MLTNVSPEVRRNFYVLRGLAFALMAFAGVAFLAWPKSFGIRSLGLLAIFSGLWVARRSNDYARKAQGDATVGWPRAEDASRVGPLAWALTGVFLVACGVFYYAMYVDQLHGGREVWAVDAFFIAVFGIRLCCRIRGREIVSVISSIWRRVFLFSRITGNPEVILN
jgi:hypothetical protein